jgi:prophage regulatory protein
MTTTHLQIREPANQRPYLRVGEVAELTGISTREIWRMVSTGEFPKQVKLSTKRSVWLRTDVDAWLRKTLAELSSRMHSR